MTLVTTPGEAASRDPAKGVSGGGQLSPKRKVVLVQLENCDQMRHDTQSKSSRLTPKVASHCKSAHYACFSNAESCNCVRLSFYAEHRVDFRKYLSSTIFGLVSCIYVLIRT